MDVREQLATELNAFNTHVLNLTTALANDTAVVSEVHAELVVLRDTFNAIVDKYEPLLAS